MNTCPNCDVPGGVTVIADVPLWPSLVAVIVTGPPASTPLTSPLPFTLAIALLLVCQVTTRPVNGLPFASLGVAVSCTVLPTATPAVAGVTVTDATGTGVTVMAAVPLWPSLVAVIVAEPATLVVTSPLLLTVATVVLFEAHVTVRPVKTLPFASLRVAVSCTVWPAGTLAEGGVTVTEATGAPATVMLAVPLWPSLVAVMVTDPAVTPVTSPLPLTVAMLLLLDDQLIARPVKGLPLASRGVAVSCTVPVIAMLAALGDTVTAATGATVTVTVAVAAGRRVQHRPRIHHAPRARRLRPDDARRRPGGRVCRRLRDVPHPGAHRRLHAVADGELARRRRHRDRRGPALPLARGRDRRRPGPRAADQPAAAHRRHRGIVAPPRHHPAAEGRAVRVPRRRRELCRLTHLHRRRSRTHRDRRHRRDTAGDRHRRRVRRAVGMTRRRDLEAPARAAMVLPVMPWRHVRE